MSFALVDQARQAELESAKKLCLEYPAPSLPHRLFKIELSMKLET